MLDDEEGTPTLVQDDDDLALDATFTPISDVEDAGGFEDDNNDDDN